MEYLVGRYDFMTARESEKNAMDDELRMYSDNYEAVVTEDDVLAAFRILRNGVCRPDFPGKSSEQCTFACYVLQELVSRSSDLLKGSRISSLDRICEFCLDFVNDMIRQGPGTSHIRLIKALMGRYFKLDKYFETLSGDRLKNQVRFLRREFRTRETGSDRNTFQGDIDSLLRNYLGFSVEQYQEARQEFIELYMFMELSFLGRSKEVREIHSSFGRRISSAHSSEIFKNPEPSVYKACLKRLEDIICRTNFYTADSEDSLKKLETVINKLLGPVEKNFLFAVIHEEVLDFVINICEKKAGSPLHPVVERVGYFYSHVKDRENDPILKGNSKLFTVMMTKMVHFLTTLEDHSLMRVSFVDAAVSNIFVKTMDKSIEHRRLMLDFIKACLKIHQSTTARAIYDCLNNCEKMFKWKENLDDAREILDLVAKVRIFGDEKAKATFAENYKRFCDYLSRQIKRDRVLVDLAEPMSDCCLRILKTREPFMFEAASEIADEIEFNGKKHKDLIMGMFSELLTMLTDPNFPWGVSRFRYGSRTAVKLTSSGMEVLDSRKLEPKDYKVICNFLITVMKENFIEENNNRPGTVYYNIYCNCGFKFIKLLDDKEKMMRAILLINEIVHLLKHDYKDVQRIALGQVRTLVANGSRVMAPFLQKIMEVYLETEDSTILYSISQMYPHNPRALEPHFQTIFELIDGKDRSVVLQILVQVAKKQPHLFTEDNIKMLIQEMFEGDDRHQIQFGLLLEPLSRRDASQFLPYLDTLMEGPISIQFGGLAYVSQVLKNVAVRYDEATAEKVMVFLEKYMNGPEDQMVTLYCLTEMRAIGGVHRGLLEKRKGVIESLRKRSNVQTTKDTCAFILDVLEGRSLTSLAEELKDVKEDVEVLEVRVTQTEEGLVLVNQEVGKQKMELNKVKVNVKKQGKKIGQLEDTVEDTKAKVEELDSKTLTHAPFWARDVAKLMNFEDILDWRFLASRLGYSNDDVRGWAQMHDPCMAMLNEWYATRKTSEATFAVLTQLQEMDRNDAAVIVENAMKMAESVTEDDSFEYPEPPDVFISYQWGVQNEVKLLKQHLEMAGFTCWMDIGQMGGGDKLFEKIDKGIRGAKVVLSCVTHKYAKSPNCKREVNLSVGLGKQMIPLLMEKLSWPPPGTMGPIFSEYLFIRFFTRSGEETGDQRYWSAAKFHELLMQLNYNNIKPDESKVNKTYKNWWNPVTEVIKIEKKNTKPEIQAYQEKVESGGASPDVFISYQWGKQKQIQLLYKRLTELGFTCWMDIYQMGGGDSLYDKIDKGVRGAKIVLSCVTTKYSVSANCRREVSLADALKKPIVPLLLEKMTWPPSGPMSMVFTQLLYITFAKDESVQERWEGDKFGELLSKLDQHVPSIVVIPSGEEEIEASPETGAYSSVKPAAVPKNPPCENVPPPLAPEAEPAKGTIATIVSHQSHQPIPQPEETLQQQQRQHQYQQQQHQYQQQQQVAQQGTYPTYYQVNEQSSYPSHQQYHQQQPYQHYYQQQPHHLQHYQQQAQHQRILAEQRIAENPQSKSCHIL